MLFIGGTSGVATLARQNNGVDKVTILDLENHSEQLYYSKYYPDHLFIINRIGNEIRLMINTPGSKTGEGWKNAGRIQVNAPNSMAVDEDRSIWIGTYYDGFVRGC